jgi:radical SAM protein with 4Fe4S-binding SPASM domain
MKTEELVKGSRAFCLMPWVGMGSDTKGDVFPCCVSWGFPVGNMKATPLSQIWNSSGMRELRLRMLEDKQSPACSRCYLAEQSGALSLRTRTNREYAHYLSRVETTRPDGTVPEFALPYLDIRFSNLCNFKCRTCRPELSSAWHRDAAALGWEVGESALVSAYSQSQDLWGQLEKLLPGIEEIYFAGGEPLLMDEHLRFLELLISKRRFDVRLLYSTNFSVLSHRGVDLAGLWDQFKSVEIVASLDASGRRGEYLRKGMVWDQILLNRERLARGCPRAYFHINATVSALNAWHLPDFHLEALAKKWVEPGKFHLNLLFDPEEYRIQALPGDFKEKIRDKYEAHCRRLAETGADLPAAKDFAAAARYLFTEDRSAAFPRLLEKTRRLDALRGENVVEVFPELAPLFGGKERGAGEIAPMDNTTLFWLARQYRDAGKVREALEHFKDLLSRPRERGDWGAVYFFYGDFLRDIGRPTEALEAFQKALEIDPAGAESRRIRRRLSDICLERIERIKAMLEARELKPAEEAILEILRCYRQLDEDRALAAVVYFELGNVHYAQGRLEAALADYEKSFAAGPGLSQAGVRRGQVYAEVLDFYSKEAARNPDNARIWLQMAWLHSQLGQLDSARKALQMALDCGLSGEEMASAWRDIDRSRAQAPGGGGLIAKAPEPRVCLGNAPDQEGIDARDIGSRRDELLMRSKTFCMLPWTAMVIQQNGQVLPCCQARPTENTGNARAATLEEIWNGPDLRQLRRNMLAGRKSPQCLTCYELEDSHVHSRRMESNKIYARHFGRACFTKPDGGVLAFRLLKLELNLSNECNFACRYCCPERSARWYAEHLRLWGPPDEGRRLQKARSDLNGLLDELDPLLPHLQRIHFSGGEPLISRWHYALLRRLVERRLQDVKITYTTNFSETRTADGDAFELWRQFRDVGVLASLDASGRRGEYIRHGQKWDQVVRNREKLRMMSPHVHFDMGPTLSVFNSFALPDLHREWLEKRYIRPPSDCHISFLMAPGNYRIQILPGHLKDQVAEKYERHIRYLHAEYGALAEQGIQAFRSAIDYMRRRDLTALLPRFRQVTASLDHSRGQRFEAVFPELAELMSEAHLVESL